MPVPVLFNVIISGGASLLHQKGPSFSAKPRCLLRLVLTVLGRKSDQLVVRHISATCDTRGFNALAETWKRSWYVMMTYYDYSMITAETCWNHPRKNMIDCDCDRLNHIEPWIKNSTPNTLIQSCLKLWLGWRRVAVLIEDDQVDSHQGQWTLHHLTNARSRSLGHLDLYYSISADPYLALA